MTIKEMHIGIDLALQNLNSNLHGVILPEEKDYFLNSVTRELLRALLSQGDVAPRGYLSLAEIKNYYSVLQHYMVNTNIELIKKLGVYDVGVFPNIPIETGTINSGIIHVGIRYKVLTADVSLNGFGGANKAIGDTFICKIPNIKSETVTLNVGSIYKIIKAGTLDYTTYGAADNNYGTVFTCTTAAVAVSDTGIINELEVLADAPVWATASVKQIDTKNYYYYISSNSYVKVGAPIMSGQLVKGVKYVIENPGTASDTDFSSVGGYNSNDVGTVFTCTEGVLASVKNKHILANDNITWIAGTVIYELRPSINRIVKPEDIKNLLTNSFGTTISSPIATLSDLNINVYTNNNFELYDVEAMYIKEPINVDYNNKVDSDLPPLVHEMLVETTARKIAGWTAGGSDQKAAE